MAISGYTSQFVTFKIKFSLVSMMPTMMAIRTKDTTERGGGAMCIWCSMKEITVLVMPTP